MSPYFETTFQITICIANHCNNLTIDFYLNVMPRRNLVTHVKSLKRQKCNDDMQRAIVAVQKRECETKIAEQRYSVPRSTLQCYLKKENVTTKPSGHCPVLGVATELKFVPYIKLMESTLFGSTRRYVIEIAFTLAQGNKIKIFIWQWICGLWVVGPIHVSPNRTRYMTTYWYFECQNSG